jgi:hypothetical protein
VHIVPLGVLATAVPLVLSAASIGINMGTSTDTVSFNNANFPGTMTLGNDTCESDQTNCTFSGSGAASGVAFTWQFSMPNDLEGSPLSYTGYGPVTTSGTPTLGFTLSDTAGDTATGTFIVTSLVDDDTPAGGGFDGVDINGAITINDITAGAGIAAFDSLFGLPSSTALSFTLDVNDCYNGRRYVACVPVPAPDPTAQYASLSVIGGVSDTPEPGTFATFGLTAAIILGLYRRIQRAAVPSRAIVTFGVAR